MITITTNTSCLVGVDLKLVANLVSCATMFLDTNNLSHVNWFFRHNNQ